MLQGAPSSGGTQRNAAASRVSELSSALQALEVGLLQDAVDVQVRDGIRGAGRLRGVAGAERAAGPRGALAAAAPGRMFRTAEAAAALAVGRLRVPGISAWFRRERMCSVWSLGLLHQVAALLITTTAPPLPASSQHMTTLIDLDVLFLYCDQSRIQTPLSQFVDRWPVI